MAMWVIVIATVGATATGPGDVEFPAPRFPTLAGCMAAAHVTVRNIDAARGYVPDHPGPTLPKWPNSASGKYAIASCIPQF